MMFQLSGMKSKIWCDRERYKAIQDSMPPRGRSELRSFLGMVDRLFRFAPDVVLMTGSRNGLLGKRVAFVWLMIMLMIHQERFERGRWLLTDLSNKMMSFYDKSKILRVFTNTSLAGVWWCAVQRKLVESEKSRLEMITCGSRKGWPWPVLYLEILAIVTSLNKTQLYILFDPNVRIHTDHQPLESLLSGASLEAESSQRVLFFRDQWSKFTFRIEFIKGKVNVKVDVLSTCNWQKENKDELKDGVLKEVSDSFMYQEMFGVAWECSDMLRRSIQLWCDFKSLSGRVQEKLAPFKKFWHLLTIDSDNVRITLQTIRRIFYWPDVRDMVLICKESFDLC